MKKFVLFLGVSFWLSFLQSCSLKEEISSLSNNEIREISLTIEAMKEEDSMQSRVGVNLGMVNGTEKLNYLWEGNDTIGIFPSKGGQVEFPIDAVGGETSAKFDGGGWGLKSQYSYSAYYPFDFFNRKSTAIPFSYLGQKQNGTGEHANEHLSDYILLATPPVTVSEDALSFDLKHQGSVIILHLKMPIAATYSSAVLYTDSKVIPIKKTINIQDADLLQTVVDLSDRLSLKLENVRTQASGEEIILWIAFPSVSESSHNMKVVVYDQYGFTYVADVYKNDKTTLSNVVFKKATYYHRHASPVLTEGFNFGVGGWGSDGTDHGGSVN